MKNEKTLYLVDGYYALFRAFYAIRHPLYSPVTGEATQAILVFAQMLLKLYALAPDYVVVAWDAPGKTFRDALFAEYAQYAVTELPQVPPVETSPVLASAACRRRRGSRTARDGKRPFLPLPPRKMKTRPLTLPPNADRRRRCRRAAVGFAAASASAFFLQRNAPRNAGFAPRTNAAHFGTIGSICSTFP